LLANVARFWSIEIQEMTRHRREMANGAPSRRQQA
jgi:hypothetical protein